MASRALGQDLRVGLELGHYRIAAKLGGGGMGVLQSGVATGALQREAADAIRVTLSFSLSTVCVWLLRP